MSKPTLADAIRAGANHIAEMGCTCDDRREGHEPDCVGWDYAEELRAALPRAEAADALAEAADAASRYDTPHSCEGTVNCGGCQADAAARRNLRAALRRYRSAK